MSINATGVVTNGIVVPSSPLPEGANVEIQVTSIRAEAALGEPICPSASEVRNMPRAERQAALAAAAVLAEEDYRSDKELTGFDAFSEEEADGDDAA
jgi:hypothetical protein